MSEDIQAFLSRLTPEQAVALRARLTPEQALALQAASRERLWRAGVLNFKRHSTQLRIRDLLNDAKLRDCKKFYISCSRRMGKSFELVLQAFEICLQKERARVVYLCPWAKDAADIVTRIVEVITSDMPEDIKPKYNSQSKEFAFQNGSEIVFKGTNGEHARYIRGGDADLVIFDEPGDMDSLKHVVDSIAMPMTMTTGGRIIIAGTPPLSPAHDSKRIFDSLKMEKAVAEFTIRDAPESHIPRHVKARYLVEAGEDPNAVLNILDGLEEPQTTTVQREYFVQWVVSTDRAVVPEFRKVKKDIVREYARPRHYDAYTALDPGFTDATGIVYAFYDFTTSCIVVEDESLLRQANSQDIHDEIKRKEAEHWGEKEPYMRISDVEKRLQADLASVHKMAVHITAKQDKTGAINLLRNFVQNKKLIINPRCEKLIHQLESAIWNEKGKDFVRDIDGHQDLVAALYYLVRNVNLHRNPYPDGFFVPAGDGTFRSPRVKKYGGPGLSLRGSTPFEKRLQGRK